jgi:hypothetical protein
VLVIEVCAKLFQHPSTLLVRVKQHLRQEVTTEIYIKQRWRETAEPNMVAIDAI